MKQAIGKAGILVITGLYLLFSVGIIKATHICMGREASVSFFTAEAKKCACSLYAREKDACCDDEHELLRIENEQRGIPTFTMVLPEWFMLEDLYTKRWIALDHFAATPSPSSTEHRLPPRIPLWKAHCSFVFYDHEVIA